MEEKLAELPLLDRDLIAVYFVEAINCFQQTEMCHVGDSGYHEYSLNIHKSHSHVQIA